MHRDPIVDPDLVAPEQSLDLSEVTRTDDRARQSEPFGADLGEVDLIALSKPVTDWQEKHQPLAPAAALLKALGGPTVQRESDVCSAALNKTSGVRMGQLTHLDRGASSVMFEFEQQSRERLAGQIFAQRKLDQRGFIARRAERRRRDLDIVEYALSFRVESRASPREPGPPSRSLKQFDV